MDLVRVEVVDAPGSPERTRLQGTVRYDDGREELYWLDLPRSAAGALGAAAGDPWLAWLLPLAATRGEPIRLSLPVDVELYDHATEVVRIWRSWYPGVAEVAVEAPRRKPAASPTDGITAAFLSGGVDSWFTVLRPRAEARPAERAPVREVITVAGFDIPIDKPDAFRGLADRLTRAAERTGHSLLPVATNLRATRWSEADWGWLAHGAALAGVALALGRRYRTVYLPATGGYRDLHPWGSHPLTDPLWSTAATAVVHDGAAFTRVEKTRLLVSEPAALESLHVCWRSASDENCGACNKCYRVMLILELLGALERCAAFSARRVDLDRAARIYCAESWDYRELTDISRLALEMGRRDVARAVQRAMRRSVPLRRRLAWARALREAPVLGRWAGLLERQLVAGWLV